MIKVKTSWVTLENLQNYCWQNSSICTVAEKSQGRKGTPLWREASCIEFNNVATCTHTHRHTQNPVLLRTR